MAGYDVAQICMNGHVANPASRAYPDPQRKFCARCGAPLVQRCTACSGEIKGIYVEINPWYTAHSAPSYRPPAYCESCGAPFPWTERKLQAASELIEGEQSLTLNEKQAFETDIKDAMRETPRTPAAAIRIRALLAKVPGKVGSALRDIVVDVLSEAAKKIILGP